LRRHGSAPNAQIVHGVVNKSWLEMRGLPHKPAGGYNLVDNKAGLKGGDIEPLFVLNLMDNSVENLIRKR
jgi:hypothetical protein